MKHALKVILPNLKHKDGRYDNYSIVPGAQFKKTSQ